MSLSLKVSRKVVRRGVVLVLVVVLAAGGVGGLLVWVGAAHRAVAAGTAVNLGDAGSYVVLASGTVTGSATSAVTGDVGGSVVNGLNGQVAGAVRTGSGTAQALADLGEAADTLSSETVAGTLPRTSGTLGPGVYRLAGALDIPGGLTLDAGGDADATFVVRTESTFSTGDGTRIALAGGARACHVFWMADDSATVAGTVVGTVVAGTGLTLHDGASVTGRLLSRTGDVTLDHATARVPTDCSGPTGPTAVTAPGPTPGGTAATGAGAVLGGTPAAGRAAAVRAASVTHGGSAGSGTASRRAGDGTAAAGGGAHRAGSPRVAAAATGGAHPAAGGSSRGTGADRAATAPAGRAHGGDAPTGDVPTSTGRPDDGTAATAENVIRSRLGGLDDLADGR